jgi:hypothetical protein
MEPTEASRPVRIDVFIFSGDGTIQRHFVEQTSLTASVASSYRDFDATAWIIYTFLQNVNRNERPPLLCVVLVLLKPNFLPKGRNIQGTH